MRILAILLLLTACAKKDEAKSAQCQWVNMTTYDFGDGQGRVKSLVYACVDSADKACTLIRSADEPAKQDTDCEGELTVSEASGQP